MVFLFSKKYNYFRYVARPEERVKIHACIRVITEIFELSNGSKIGKMRMRKKKEKKREKERRRKEKEKKLKNRSIYVKFADG